MKKLYACIAIVLILSTFSNAQNTVLTEVDWTTYVVNDNFILKEDGNYLTKSTDQGATFSKLLSHTFVSIRAINFFNDNLGFVFQTDGSIYKTIDGAASWTQIEGVNGTSSTFTAYDENSYVIVSDNDSIYKTTTGGASWYPVAQPDLEYFGGYSSLQINPNGNGVFVGEKNYDAYLFFTSDFGENWTNKKNLDNSRTAVLMDNGNIIASEHHGKDMKLSTDGGDSWVTQRLALAEGQDLYAIAGNGRYVAAVCTTWLDLVIVCSEDYGQTWDINEYLGDMFRWTYRVQLTKENVVYSFGSNGGGSTLEGYRSSNNLSCFSTITSQDELINPTSIVYPNPSNGQFNMGLSFDGDYSIFDLTGKTVLTSTLASFDLSAYPAGLYFVKYQSNNINYVEKIIRK